MLKSSTLFNIYSQEKNNSNGNLKTRIGKIGLALIATAVVAVAALPSQSLINLKQLPSSTRQLFPATQLQTFKPKQTRTILVLDLDETLVYARRKSRPSHPNYIQVFDTLIPWYIEPRPYLTEFLAETSKVFRLMVFTAGTKYYADSVIDRIDPNRVIEKRFYRDSCIPYGNSFVKDLQTLREKMPQDRQKRMVLVDDNQFSIQRNLPNAILIKPFEGDQQDEELVKLYIQLVELHL